jgi:hypothetical protein
MPSIWDGWTHTVILIRLSVQALRGRWLAALIAGFQDMGD